MNKKIMAVLLSITLIIALDACSSKPKPNAKTKSNNVIASDDAQVKSVSLSSSEKKEVVYSGSELTPASSLPCGEFGRENPFSPLVADGKNARTGGRSNKKVDNNMDSFAEGFKVLEKLFTPAVEVKEKIEPKKMGPDLRLTLIINEKVAVFEEDNVSRNVAVGDTIAGMKVMEIRKEEVILGEGDKKYTIKLGVLSENFTDKDGQT